MWQQCCWNVIIIKLPLLKHTFYISLICFIFYLWTTQRVVINYTDYHSLFMQCVFRICVMCAMLKYADIDLNALSLHISKCTHFIFSVFENAIFSWVSVEWFSRCVILLFLLTPLILFLMLFLLHFYISLSPIGLPVVKPIRMKLFSDHIIN